MIHCICKQNNLKKFPHLSPDAIDVEFDHVFATRIVHRIPLSVLWVDDAAKQSKTTLYKHAHYPVLYSTICKRTTYILFCAVIFQHISTCKKKRFEWQNSALGKAVNGQ
jgi:hypothetical protein